MKKTTVADLGKQTKYYLDIVENGEVVRIYREGQPVAEIVPIRKKTPSWKKGIPRLRIPGISVSHEILKDRSESET